MSTQTPKTVRLGELVVIAFDMAARHSTSPREISRLATTTVMRVLRSPGLESKVGAMQETGCRSLTMHNKGTFNAIA